VCIGSLSLRVCSSGSHTASNFPAASSRASVRASSVSVFAFGVADLPQLLGVRDHDPRDVRLKNPRDRKRARPGLKRHVIIGLEALSE
jgi:hypothetical protein